MHYTCFPQNGGDEGTAGIPWGLDQEKITSPRNLAEHFDIKTGSSVNFKIFDTHFWHTFVTHGLFQT